MTYLVVIVAFVIMQTLSSLGMLKSSVNGYLVPVCAYIVLAVSLNLLVGVCGELSLGHAGFMGIGAFTGIVISALLKSYIANDILRLAIAMYRCMSSRRRIPNQYKLPSTISQEYPPSFHCQK